MDDHFDELEDGLLFSEVSCITTLLRTVNRMFCTCIFGIFQAVFSKAPGNK